MPPRHQPEEEEKQNPDGSLDESLDEFLFDPAQLFNKEQVESGQSPIMMADDCSFNLIAVMSLLKQFGLKGDCSSDG